MATTSDLYDPQYMDFRLACFKFNPPFNGRRKPHFSEVVTSLINRGMKCRISPSLEKRTVSVFIQCSLEDFQRIKKEISIETGAAL